MKKNTLGIILLMASLSATAVVTPFVAKNQLRTQTKPLAAAMPAPHRVTEKTDITAAYLANASFEDDAALCTAVSANRVTNAADGLRGWNETPTGWNVNTSTTKLILTDNCFTDNNFGKSSMADGNYCYYLRMGWSTGTSTLWQNTKAALAAGTYQLTFSTKAFCANSATSNLTVKVADGTGTSLGTASVNCEAGAEGIMATSAWKTSTITFTLNATSSITISGTADWLSGGSCILFDDFRLFQMPDGYIGGTVEGGTEAGISSPTEGHITHDFVSEAAMKDDLLQMLANSLTYAKNIWYNCTTPNNQGEACGYFKANSAGNSNEDGVRTNADFSMICAFLYKYAQGKVTLPAGISWDEVKQMAVKSLVFGYSTHKANKFKVTSNNSYWGSVSTADYTWESSLWAMSLAYSSYFLADELTGTQKTHIYNLIKAECNYELNRTVPTGYNGDTKAEENGWEADVLACALGLYPNDALAPQWFDRLRLFAINSYSQVDDAADNTVIDPEYDQKTVANLYKGQNLYDDYTLQNHNLFHTSYQNVVMQELGEAYLAMKIFQGSTPKWHTNALMHNNQNVMDKVLNELALADGELAMPNGNDWSMFLYDQITSYTTMACFLQDANALMLENLAYKNIKARQTTTTDGSWLLNSDIGPRRMGVEGHRVMMTWLMHEAASTSGLTPTSWDDFSAARQEAKLFLSQNIVRASNSSRFVCFSWSAGLGNYTGYIAANSADKNKILIPYRANNTGNFLGWYTVSGKNTDATPVVSGVYDLNGNSFVMNGALNTNGASLKNSFVLYATPGNVVVYLDYVKALASGTLTKEQGGLMAVSTDPFTKSKRTLYYKNGRQQLDGTSLTTFASDWVNIDNQVGIVAANKGKQMAFGDRTLTNSIYTSKIYPSYSASSRAFAAGDVVDRRNVTYYSLIDSAATALMAKQLQPLADSVPVGWNGLIVPDTDGAHYLLLSNFCGKSTAELQHIKCPEGAPVFSVPTTIANGASSATFTCKENHSVANTLRIFVPSGNVTAQQVEGDSLSAYLTAADAAVTANVAIVTDGKTVSDNVNIPANGTVRVTVENNAISYVAATLPEQPGDDMKKYADVTSQYLQNPSFEEDNTYGTLNESGVTLGEITYKPCYTNSVPSANSKWPNVLPVQGWTATGTFSSGSNYCRMYSMPYSESVYCVSPSNVGNYSAISSAPLDDDTCGVRCLTVLNSWDAGINRIEQTATLPAGQYRLLIDANMVCNSIGSRGEHTVVSGSNTNTSYCGLSYGSTTDYRFPQEANTWETISYDFTLESPMPVTISLGYGTSAAVGAANNTLLYLDNVRLLQNTEYVPSAIVPVVPSDSAPVNVYQVDGRLVRSHRDAANATEGLPHGIYIVGKKKVMK